MKSIIICLLISIIVAPIHAQDNVKNYHCMDLYAKLKPTMNSLEKEIQTTSSIKTAENDAAIYNKLVQRFSECVRLQNVEDDKIFTK
jgi:hypothetical protein